MYTVLLGTMLGFLLGFVLAAILIIVLSKDDYRMQGLLTAGSTSSQSNYQPFNSEIPTSSIKDTNKAADAVNGLLQFLFQELKDTGKVRRYFIRKIKIELDELTRRKVLSSLIRNIEIRDFDMGESSPEFNTLTLRDCKFEGTGLLENVQLYTHITYRQGFALSIAVETLLDKCAVFTFKLNKFESDGYFVLSREPFTHWYLSFARDPYIEMKVSTHVGPRNIPQLANLIAYQLKKAILRKHVWPAYKVRFRPFFNAPPTLDIDDEIAGAPYGKQMFRAALNCMPFEVVAVDLRRIERLADTFADMLNEPRFKFPQQLVIGTTFSESSVYDEISTRKFFDDRYPALRKIQLPRGMHDCFKLAEIEVFRRGFVYITKTQKSIERLLDVGDVLLQANGQIILTIESFNSIYNDKQLNDNVIVLIKRTRIPPPPPPSKNRTDKSKSSSSASSGTYPGPSDIESAVRQNLMSIDTWFVPEQLARMHYSQPKLPAKYVSVEEIVTIKPKNSDAYCNVLLLSVKEFYQPAILAYCCFTLEEIIADCDLTQKRDCHFSRSLFPANFHSGCKGLGNATVPFGFAHSMAFGHIVIGFRLIENVETFLQDHQYAHSESDLASTSKQESHSLLATEDEMFFVHQLHPFRVDSTSYCKICNGKIWMKNALRCQLCGVLCHQKCASTCYAKRCPGYKEQTSSKDQTDTMAKRRNAVSLPTEDQASEILIFGYHEARMMLYEDEGLYTQTLLTGHQLSSSSSNIDGKENLKAKAKELTKAISKEFAPYIKGLGTPTRELIESSAKSFIPRFNGHSILDNTTDHITAQAKEKLKSLATLYLVHLHAIDYLCTDAEIVTSIIEDIVDRICRNELLNRLDNSSLISNDNNALVRVDCGGSVGGRMKFLQNVGKLVNRGGSYVVNRYRDKMMNKVWPGSTANGHNSGTLHVPPSNHLSSQFADSDRKLLKSAESTGDNESLEYLSDIDDDNDGNKTTISVPPQTITPKPPSLAIRRSSSFIWKRKQL